MTEKITYHSEKGFFKIKTFSVYFLFLDFSRFRSPRRTALHQNDLQKKVLWTDSAARIKTSQVSTLLTLGKFYYN